MCVSLPSAFKVVGLELSHECSKYEGMKMGMINGNPIVNLGVLDPRYDFLDLLVGRYILVIKEPYTCVLKLAHDHRHDIMRIKGGCPACTLLFDVGSITALSF